jgi:hypothetical protein
MSLGGLELSALVAPLSEDIGDPHHVANELRSDACCGERWRVEVQMDGCIDVCLNAIARAERVVGFWCGRSTVKDTLRGG